MTILQAQWSRQHDWYVSEKETYNGIAVMVRCDMVKDKILKFTNFEKLYEWAGY